MILFHTCWRKITASTNDAEDIAGTNVSSGSANGVDVNVGTFRSWTKINDTISDSFDIKKLFDKPINDTQSEEGNKADEAKEEDENIMKQTQDVTLLIKRVIHAMEQEQATFMLNLIMTQHICKQIPSASKLNERFDCDEIIANKLVTVVLTVKSNSSDNYIELKKWSFCSLCKILQIIFNCWMINDLIYDKIQGDTCTNNRFKFIYNNNKRVRTRTPIQKEIPLLLK